MELFMNLLPTSKPTGLFTSQRHRLNTKSRRLVPGVSPRSRFTSASFQANISFASKLTYDQKQRRSANYQPSYWDYEELLSQKNEYAGQFYMEKSNVLKEQVEMVLDEEMKPLCQLELIDNLQRLGISYHFQDKIGSILSRIYFESIRNIIPRDKGLYETALEFRLLRQHNFNVPQGFVDVDYTCDGGAWDGDYEE